MRMAGSVASHLARRTFCWLPPERSPTARRAEGVAILSSRTKRSASATAFGSDIEREARNLVQHGDGDVVRASPSARNRPPSLRSSGTMPMPAVDRVPGPAEAHRPAVDADRAAGRGARPEDRFAGLRAPGAHQSGEADDLARPDREARLPNEGFRLEGVDLEQDSARASASSAAREKWTSRPTIRRISSSCWSRRRPARL